MIELRPSTPPSWALRAFQAFRDGQQVGSLLRLSYAPGKRVWRAQSLDGERWTSKTSRKAAVAWLDQLR